MGDARKPIIILMADDDADDCLLAQEALEDIDTVERLDFVGDGEALMDYLHRTDAFTYLKDTPLPALILLDLNMPRKGGLEALREIKSEPALRRIPIVILTMSETEEDVYESYDNGATSFITKSVTLSSLVDVVAEIGKYWLEIVELPPESATKRT